MAAAFKNCVTHPRNLDKDHSFILLPHKSSCSCRVVNGVAPAVYDNSANISVGTKVVV